MAKTVTKKVEKTAAKVAKKATAVKAKAVKKANGNLLAERDGKEVWRDGNTILKKFDARFTKANIFNEALNEARVEETGLPVPKLIEVLNLKGVWAIRREYIEGTTLADLMASDKKNFNKYLKLFVEIHCALLKKKSPLMNSQRAKLESALTRAELSDEQRYDLQMRLDSLPKDDCVCHGDFNPTNVIIKPDGSWSVIDWSHARKGNKLADVARTYLLLWLSSHLVTAEKYLDGMCEALKVSRQDVQLWMPIVAATLTTRPENAKYKNMLLHWASVVDYV